MCRGVLGRLGLDSTLPDYTALLTAQSKQSSRLSSSKMSSSSQLPPPTIAAATDNTSTPRFPPWLFLPPLQKSGNLCFGVHAYRAGIPGKAGKWRRAIEQADMSLFGQECNNERGERSVYWIGRKGENICLHFPEPLSLSSFSSHGRQQPGERKEIN